MTTPGLDEQFNLLHEELGDIFSQNEETKKGIVEFHKTAKEFVKGVADLWEKDQEKERKNFVKQTLNQQYNEKLEPLVKQANDLFAGFLAYMKTGIELYDRIKATMQQVMGLAKQFDLDPIPEEEIEKSIATLEPVVISLGEDVASAITTFQQFQDQFSTIQTDCAKWFIEKDSVETIDVLALPKDGFINDEQRDIWDKAHFYLVIYEKWLAEAKAVLNQLMYEQFPEFKPYDHPAIIGYMERVNDEIAEKVILHCHTLLTQQQEGMIPAEKYAGKLEGWRKFYGKPEEPGYLLTDENRDDENRFKVEKMTDEEWERHMAEQNELTMTHHRWKERTKTEWYNVMQPLNFDYLPQLSNMDGDYWLLYAMNMRDDYEYWKSWLEMLHTFISLDLDPTLLDGKAEIWREKMSEAYRNLTTEERRANDAKWEDKWSKG